MTTANGRYLRISACSSTAHNCLLLAHDHCAWHSVAAVLAGFHLYKQVCFQVDSIYTAIQCFTCVCKSFARVAYAFDSMASVLDIFDMPASHAMIKVSHEGHATCQQDSHNCWLCLNSEHLPRAYCIGH